ncbi:MAG: CopG family transcriptional regulator [Chthoniobacterales bacterium]
MRKRTVKYSDDKGEIIGELHRIRDELPSVDDLAGGGPIRQTKVTIALDDDALSFFKGEARRRHTSYQRMIRRLVQAYAQAHAAPH